MATVKKRKINYQRIIILIAAVALIICIGIFTSTKLLGGKGKKEQNPIKVVDKLEKYGYTLDENETSYYQGLFHQLKEELKKEEIDEEAYAKLVSQLFVADFFNLNNKITKNDIGGTQFVYQAYQSDFQKYATEGMYKYVESNLYGDRKQELPVVKNVEVTNLLKESYDYLKETDEEAYIIDVVITYEKDLGYQTGAEITLVHVDHKLEIVKMQENV